MRVLDVDIYAQLPYIVLEYVGETTLATQICNLSKLPAQRIAQIGVAVAAAPGRRRRRGRYRSPH